LGRIPEWTNRPEGSLQACFDVERLFQGFLGYYSNKCDDLYNIYPLIINIINIDVGLSLCSVVILMMLQNREDGLSGK
jgi:hypothetical protein